MPVVSRGALFIAPIDYTDFRSRKTRPVCVVSSEGFNQGQDVVVAMITTTSDKPSLTRPGDIHIDEWRRAGLLQASTLRAGRLQTIKRSLLHKRIGALPDGNIPVLDAALKRVLALP